MLILPQLNSGTIKASNRKLLAFRLFSSTVKELHHHRQRKEKCPSVKIRLASLFLLTIFFATPVWTRPHKPETPTDAGYVFALAAANHFLHAWQTGDLESGMVLLSDGLRHSQNADQIEDFFSDATTKTRSYEITTGHGHPSRYTFPIVLVMPRGSHITRKFSEITMIETGKDDWVVDKLP